MLIHHRYEFMRTNVTSLILKLYDRKHARCRVQSLVKSITLLSFLLNKICNIPIISPPPPHGARFVGEKNKDDKTTNMTESNIIFLPELLVVFVNL